MRLVRASSRVSRLVSRPCSSRRVRSSITISSSEQLPGALADAVDGALDLPGAGQQPGVGVGDGEAQVVVAVDGELRRRRSPGHQLVEALEVARCTPPGVV